MLITRNPSDPVYDGATSPTSFASQGRLLTNIPGVSGAERPDL